LEGVRLASPFVLRTAEPPIGAASGREVTRVSRLGKRIVFDLDLRRRATKGEEQGTLHLVIHLMIAGRFRWKPVETGGARAAIPGKVGLAAFDFERGTLILTEASTKKRAS